MMLISRTEECRFFRVAVVTAGYQTILSIKSPFFEVGCR